jgi:ketosteroid isomerase-like protein
MKTRSVRFSVLLIFILAAGAGVIAAQEKQTKPVAPNKTAAQEPAKTEESRGDSESAIKSLLIEQTAAWNRGDLEGFMKGYWNSPNLTFYSGGNIAQGWQAAMDRYKKNYQGTGKEMGKLEFQDLEVDLLSRDAAEVTGKWQLTKSDGTKPHGLFTLILKKIPSAGWQIVHDHTSSAE